MRATNEALLKCLPPSAQYAVVPRAGHYWYADNAAEGTRMLLEFLRRHRSR